MCTSLRTVSQKFKISSAKSRSPTLACDTVRSVVRRSSSYKSSVKKKLRSRHSKYIHLTIVKHALVVKHGTKKKRQHLSVTPTRLSRLQDITAIPPFFSNRRKHIQRLAVDSVSVQINKFKLQPGRLQSLIHLSPCDLGLTTINIQEVALVWSQVT